VKVTKDVTVDATQTVAVITEGIAYKLDLKVGPRSCAERAPEGGDDVLVLG